MMIRFNSCEAKLNFSQLITQVANGKEVIITRSGKDFARVIAIEKPVIQSVHQRIKTLRE